MHKKLFYPKRFKHLLYQKHRKFKVFRNLKWTHLFNITKPQLVKCLPITSGTITNKHLRRLSLFFTKLKKKKNPTQYIWLPYFPHTPLFKKSKNARMGIGKGKWVGWYAIIFPFLSFFEAKNIRLNRVKRYGNVIISRLNFKVFYSVRNK